MYANLRTYWENWGSFFKNFTIENHFFITKIIFYNGELFDSHLSVVKIAIFKLAFVYTVDLFGVIGHFT